MSSIQEKYTTLMPQDKPETNEEIPLQVILNPSSQMLKNINYLQVCSVYSTFIANLTIVITIMVLQFNNNPITLKISSSALKYMFQNLNSNPIIDIAPEDPRTECASEYDPIMLKLWSKAEIECLIDIKVLRRTESVCGKNGKGCFNGIHIKPIPIYGWSNSSWCTKRLDLGTDYVKMITYPPNYRECSSGICVKDSLDCPLTSVTLTSSPISADSKQYGSSHYLTLYRISGEAPLVDVDITENGMVYHALVLIRLLKNQRVLVVL